MWTKTPWANIDQRGCRAARVALTSDEFLYRASAGMAELADAADSKSAGLRPLGVQLPLPAPQLPLPATPPPGTSRCSRQSSGVLARRWPHQRKQLAAVTVLLNSPC